MSRHKFIRDLDYDGGFVFRLTVLGFIAGQIMTMSTPTIPKKTIIAQPYHRIRIE
jgi:hypothetical protein